MNTLVLIGAGNIGSRHMQSLATLGGNWSFTVVEPNPSAMFVAQSRYNDVASYTSPKPTYLESLDGLPDQIDVCILATSATGRLDLIEELLARSKCRYMIIEKVVFQSVQDFFTAENIFRDHDVSAWVNCPRRQWPVFKDLKNALVDGELIKCSFTGEKFGMACNAIHFIDIFQFLTGCSEILVDGSHLSLLNEDTKRIGSIEFLDTLNLATPRGDTFDLTRLDTGRPVSLIMTLNSENLSWTFDQCNFKVVMASSETKWKSAEQLVDVPLQSYLTAPLVRDLMAHGKCELATLSESKMAHLPMLNAFLDRIEAITGERPDRCNIT